MCTHCFCSYCVDIPSVDTGEEEWVAATDISEELAADDTKLFEYFAEQLLRPEGDPALAGRSSLCSAAVAAVTSPGEFLWLMTGKLILSYNYKYFQNQSELYFDLTCWDTKLFHIRGPDGIIIRQCGRSGREGE